MLLPLVADSPVSHKLQSLFKLLLDFDGIVVGLLLLYDPHTADLANDILHATTTTTTPLAWHTRLIVDTSGDESSELLDYTYQFHPGSICIALFSGNLMASLIEMVHIYPGYTHKYRFIVAIVAPTLDPDELIEIYEELHFQMDYYFLVFLHIDRSSSTLTFYRMPMLAKYPGILDRFDASAPEQRRHAMLDRLFDADDALDLHGAQLRIKCDLQPPQLLLTTDSTGALVVSGIHVYISDLIGRYLNATTLFIEKRRSNDGLFRSIAEKKEFESSKECERTRTAGRDVRLYDLAVPDAVRHTIRRQ